MDDNNLKIWRERWPALQEVQRAEAQAMTIEDRWRKFEVLVGMAEVLGPNLARRDKQAEEVALRWRRLRGLVP